MRELVQLALLGCFASAAWACNVTTGTPGDAGRPSNPAAAEGDEDASHRFTIPITDPDVDFPPTLSEVGLYPEGLNPERPNVRAIAYAPRSELWSNDLTKQRFVALPSGAAIQANLDPWGFPLGTVFFKTFSDLDGPVETRMLRRTETEFEYAAYQWDEDRAGARLLDGRLNVEVVARTQQGATPHTIPSRLTCQQCHESSNTQILGFSGTQLWDSPTDTADVAPLFSEDPSLTDPIPQADELTRRVLDYFVGNCVHCHNGSVGLASSFDLGPSVAIANTINRPTDSNATAPGIRVVPGSPEQSILFQALSGEGDGPDVKAMPPEGVQLLDRDGIDLIREWIEQL